MKRVFFIVYFLSCFCCQGFAQLDLSQYLNRVYEGEESTALSIFNTNPAFSADGKRLYFIRAVDGEEKFEAVFVDLEKAGIL